MGLNTENYQEIFCQFATSQLSTHGNTGANEGVKFDIKIPSLYGWASPSFYIEVAIWVGRVGGVKAGSGLVMYNTGLVVLIYF